MEVEGENPSSLPSNYVTIHQLKERWLQQQQQQQKSPSKPEPENPNPKPKPNENAIKPTNTQNQRPNFGRVTKEHKLKEVKVDDNGSTSKTLVADDMKNPYKNDAAKHNQRPNYRPVANQPKTKVDDGSTSKTKTFVADDLKNPKIRPMGDDDGLSTKALVVDVTDNKLNGENETAHSNSNPNLKKKKNRHRRRNPNIVTDQNPTEAEPEKGAKVVEGEMEKKSYPANQNPVGAELKPETEVEVVEEKRKERRKYGHRNGNLRFGAESERKTEPEPEQEAEVVEEKMKKKNYGRGKPADRNPNGAELKSQMVEEVVMEKWKRGLGYGRRNGNSRVVWEQKETAPVDGNNDGGGGGGVVEEVVKERNVGQGRDRNEGYRRDRNGGYGSERNGGYGRDRNGGYGRDKKRVPSGSFGEQQRLIWVKKGESVVPN